MLKLSVKQINDDLDRLYSKHFVKDDSHLKTIKIFSNLYFKINNNLRLCLEKKYLFEREDILLINVNNISFELKQNKNIISFREACNGFTLSLKINVSHNNYLLDIEKINFYPHSSMEKTIPQSLVKLLHEYLKSHFNNINSLLNYEIEHCLKTINQIIPIINAFNFSQQHIFEEIFKSTLYYTLDDIETIGYKFSEELLLSMDNDIKPYLKNLKKHST